MPPEEINELVNAATPLVAAGVFVVVGAYQIWKVLPWKPLWRTLIWTGLAVGLCVGATKLVDRAPEGSLGGAWVGVGLPVYLIRRYVLGADARAQEAQRLLQARGHERRRAALPTQNSGAPGIP